MVVNDGTVRGWVVGWWMWGGVCGVVVSVVVGEGDVGSGYVVNMMVG